MIAVHPDKNSHTKAGEACAKLQQVDLVIFIIPIIFVIISKSVVIVTIIFVAIAIFVIITVIVITAIFVNIINVIIDISGL